MTEPSDSIGANDEDQTLDLWLAREAVRHGEALSKENTNNLLNIHSRAASLLGWSATAIAALAAAAFSTKGYLAIAAQMTCGLLIPTVLFCFLALRPSQFSTGLQTPKAFLTIRSDAKLTCEIDVLWSIALGIEKAIENDRISLKKKFAYVNQAYLAFLIAVLIGVVVMVVSSFSLVLV